MSELKWNWAYYPYLDTPEKQAESALKAGYIKVVNKYEADKVIAHNKFKRCLDMARWCEAEAQKFLTQQGAMIGFPWTDRFQYLQWQITHYSRWHRIWLKLAKKFKEAK